MKLELAEYIDYEIIKTFDFFKLYAYYNLFRVIQYKKKLELLETILVSQTKKENIENFIKNINESIDLILMRYDYNIENDYYNYENLKNLIKKALEQNKK